MSADDDRVEDLAASISDDQPVDWAEAVRDVEPADRARVESLRDVSRIAKFYRDLQRSPAGTAVPERSSAPSPLEQSLIGTTIDDSYRVERLIGEGGFGVVYECTEVELGRKVALKKLKPDVVGERELKRFVVEGRNLASLNHPNVVHIYRLGNTGDGPYIVMEYVGGQTLRKIMETERPPAPKVLEIMRQVAGGLGAIHVMGIVHRDLTPNNIMVLDNGTAKILDLGLSKNLGVLTSMDSRNALMGTLSYVSPEQLEGRDTGTAAEVFSFGVIMYEALAGAHPFPSEHPMSLLYNIAHKDPEPIERHLPECPPVLAGLVARCLEKRPEDRPSGMAEIEKAIAELINRSDVQRTPAPHVAPSTAPRDTPRNPYLNRVMIKHRDDFFGRTSEIKRIYARLNATPPGSISIVGDRKIGKSSLMNYVYARANRQQYLEHPENMVMVYLDLQQDKTMSMESFVRSLLGIANLELRGRLDVSDCSLNLDGIKDMVQRLDSGGFRLALLLDEFEAVTTNPSFSLEFFSFLRYLANHYNVAYLTSSARDLQILCHTKEISDSPFFNIFSTMRLSVFTKPEAEALIKQPSERVGKPLAQYTDKILDMAGLFPFFLQMVCSHAIEYLDEHPDNAPDFAAIRHRFLEEARLHYRYVWESFDPHERSTILRVAKGQTMPDALKHVLGELETRSYVTAADGKPKLFASTFDEFVKGEAGKEAKPSLLGRLFGGKS